MISVQNGQHQSLAQMRAFLEGSGELRFEAKGRAQIYEWVGQVLVEQEYAGLGRKDKGVVRRYLEKMTGLSRAQLTRLIRLYRQSGRVRPPSYRRHRFARRYTAEDVTLLAETDQAHEVLSGPATQKLLYRAFYEFGDQRYVRLARLSTAHIYRLRRRKAYREKHFVYQPTRPTPVSIGERKRPDPQQRPGFLRVDTVHQGDEGEQGKGIYHINAVDEVTQWEVVGAVPQISEAWLQPLLVAMLAQFPFRILGFHSDNGSEFINHTVAKLLNKLLVEQTKSRPRRSTDNGLVEAKNGAVIRKHMGYRHIAAEHAAAVEQFYEQHFNPYLNFHRPCGVPEQIIDEKGRRRRVYRWYATPWEILRQLPDLARHLKEGVTVQSLVRRAQAMTDLEAARRMQEAKHDLFTLFHHRRSA